MSLIKLATNFKQFIRPIQRNKAAFTASALLGAGIGAATGNHTKYEKDEYGWVKKDRYGNNKIKPGASGIKRALIGAGIGAATGAAMMSPMIHDLEKIKLRGAKFKRALNNDTRRFKQESEKRRKKFEEDTKKNFYNNKKSNFKFKFSEDFKKDFQSKYGHGFDDFFEDFNEDTGSFFGGHSNGYKYNPPPPPPPMPKNNASQNDIANFFKKHHNTNHTEIKTKAHAKKMYRQGARKHHPDSGGSEEAFKNYQNEWEKIENSSWFEKLASYRDMLWD